MPRAARLHLSDQQKRPLSKILTRDVMRSHKVVVARIAPVVEVLQEDAYLLQESRNSMTRYLRGVCEARVGDGADEQPLLVDRKLAHILCEASEDFILKQVLLDIRGIKHNHRGTPFSRDKYNPHYSR